ncbi:MAG TPA: adenylate/guanylate cyclase domain-containing protein [Solirubrobacteraceae bacterium]
MIDPLDRVVRAIARRNSYALVWAQHLLAHLIMLGGLGLLSLYQPMSAMRFLVLTIVSQVLVALDNLVSIRMTLVMWRPVRAWEQGARDAAATVAAWTALATLPIEYLRRVRRYPFLFAYLPFIAFATWELSLPWYSFGILAVAGTVVLAYSLIVRYFTMEIVVRPVLEEVARELPHDFRVGARALSLRWRLLAVAPIINVITGVVVAGLSAHGHHATLDDLGISWLIAVVVSFTISLELTVLMVRTVVTSLGDLRRATDRISAGDFSARVPVVAADEIGTLAQSFNTMVEGLDERERLREAFGAYVDPELADRILKEGFDLAGEELEASILFLDIRDFTAFAERAAPAEVVALLNELWTLIVPVLLRNGGHANKFIGDGLLGVFGAPDPRPDHAARAVRAALEIVGLVEDRYHGRITVGIGVNSGSVVAGTVGGGGRVEFTVIGDAVNTASRVEAVTREIGDDVLITEATRRLLPEAEFQLQERDEVALRGRQAGVRLWAPLARDASARAARTGEGTRGRAGAAPVPD